MKRKDYEQSVEKQVSDATAKEMKKKRPVWKGLLIALLCVAVVLGGLAAVVLTLPQAVIEENVQQEEPLVEEEVEVTPELPPVADVRNIALFGIDQKEGSVGRSDAIMILSIDKTNQKIKLTSIDRDSLVAIDGHGEEKLTHAWAYGHGKLAVKTLNQNFGMNITDYVYVNFTEFVGAIDYLGGVEVDISSAELEYMNQNLGEKERLTATGKQTLTGKQALAYSRNRSDGTSRRGGRQREVLEAMLNKVRQQPISKLPATLTRLLSLCHTTMSSKDITELAKWVLTASPKTEELSLPTSELKPWGGVIDRQRGWVRVYDLEAATVVLHNFVYETDTEVTDVTKHGETAATKESTTTTVAP